MKDEEDTLSEKEREGCLLERRMSESEKKCRKRKAKEREEGKEKRGERSAGRYDSKGKREDKKGASKREVKSAIKRNNRKKVSGSVVETEEERMKKEITGKTGGERKAAGEMKTREKSIGEKESKWREESQRRLKEDVRRAMNKEIKEKESEKERGERVVEGAEERQMERGAEKDDVDAVIVGGRGERKGKNLEYRREEESRR